MRPRRRRAPRWALAVVTVAVSSACTREPARETREERPPSGDVAPGFVTPTAGTIVVEGSQYVVRWQAPAWNAVHIGVAMGGKDKGHLGTDLAPSDSLTWDVPVGFVTGFGLTRSDQVRLRLENAADPRQFVDSDSFTVIGAEP